MNKRNKILISDFLEEQLKVEEMMYKASKLMDELDKIEEESIEKVYDNKAKLDRMINYSKSFNNYDFSKLISINNLLDDFNEGKEHLEGFFKQIQEFISQLNLFINTFVENIINYKMAKKFLSAKQLKLPAREVSFLLEGVDVKAKLLFMKEEFYELTDLKNFKGSLTQISKHTFPLKFNYYDFNNTNGKIKVLVDYENYLFYRQLYFRLNRYSEEFGKYNKTENFDIMFFDFFQGYLSKNDIFSLKSFISGFYILLHNYPLNTGDSRIILKSMLNTFFIEFDLNGEVKIEMVDILIKKLESGIEDKDFLFLLKDLKKKIVEIFNILHKLEYPKEIEIFKKNNNLSNEEFEYFKDFRFFALYKDGFSVIEKYGKVIIKNGLENKLKNKNKYFDILSKFAYSVSSIYGSYGDFNKLDITILKKEIDNFSNKDISDLPLFFVDDLSYMKSIVSKI